MHLNLDGRANPGLPGRAWTPGKHGYLIDLQRYLRRADLPEYGPEHFVDILRALGYPILTTTLTIRDPADRRAKKDVSVLVAVLDCNEQDEDEVRVLAGEA